MIAQFNNINSGSFSLNGISYYKVFIPVGIGSVAVKVVSIYDARFELLPPTNITDIRVNGTAYGSVASLVNALKGLVFDYPDATAQITQLQALINENIGSVVSNNGITTLTPTDARNVFSGNVSGAIKIALPNSWSNTMMKLFVEIYDYTTNESISLILSGYTSTTVSSWYNTSTQIIASKTDRNFVIRFGHTGSKCCIYIGELNSTWTWLKVAIKKGFFSHSTYNENSWLTGWNIALEASAFQNITRTHTNNLPVSQ